MTFFLHIFIYYGVCDDFLALLNSCSYAFLQEDEANLSQFASEEVHFRESNSGETMSLDETNMVCIGSLLLVYILYVSYEPA